MGQASLATAGKGDERGCGWNESSLVWWFFLKKKEGGSRKLEGKKGEVGK